MIKTEIRRIVGDFFTKNAKANTIDKFVDSVISSAYQKQIKKIGSHTYPVRFSEVEKIEVVKAPDA